MFSKRRRITHTCIGSARRAFGALLAVLLFAFSPLLGLVRPVLAQEGNPPPIPVRAGYADWDLQFTEYDSLQSAMDALSRGEIDVMSGLSVTDERARDYLISGGKMCTSHIAVQTRVDDDRYCSGDISAMQNMTCGILRGSNVITLYSDWCTANGLQPHIVEYDSLDARNAALDQREVDAIAAGSTIPGAQKIAEFPSLDLYFMFNRSRTDLKSQLDRAMSVLSLENPVYTSALYSKYFPTSRNSTPCFSASEKAYISAHPAIRMAMLREDAPFSAETRSGDMQGILPKYCDLLSQTIGSSFQCVPFNSKEEAYAALNSGQVDLIGKVSNNIFEANSRGVVLTIPYLSMNMVQITRVGTDVVHGVSAPACTIQYVTQELSNMQSNITIQAEINGEDCFAALKSGKTDAVICPQPTATWLLNRSRSSDYMVSSFGRDTWDITCALPKSGDGNTLRSILNKSITAVDGDISQFITSETLENPADLAGTIDRMPSSFLFTFAIVVVLLLILAVSALIIILGRRRAEKRLAAQQSELAAAMETNRARHAFFGTVSHDMRTPLNGIMGFVDLALASDSPNEVRDYLAKIRTSGAVLSSLVNDTLIMSRMESGKYVLKPTPNDTKEIFDGVLEPIREMARNKGVVFKDNVSAVRRRWVMADRLSMQKILLNLLSNAIKFTPVGGTVTLTCRLAPENDKQPDTILTVSDTGIGISKEFLPRIFEPFAQENATSMDPSGTGMGLSIVKSIIDAVGGTIEVESEKGKGTAFTVRLHLEELDLPLTFAAPLPKETGDHPSQDEVLKGKHVLVCEDSELNLEIIRKLLTRHGMTVVGVENGKLGVETFQQSKPGDFDVILLDLRMPVMDGNTAARTIRALNREDAKKIPIIAVSADAYAENVAESLSAGMNAHISKPVDAKLLLRTLENFLAT